MALNKVTTFGKPTLSTLLQDNLVTFFDWEFLNAGGFTNIEIPTSGWYGADKHQLRLVDDPRYDSGQVWEGFRKTGYGRVDCLLPKDLILQRPQQIPEYLVFMLEVHLSRLLAAIPMPITLIIKMDESSLILL